MLRVKKQKSLCIIDTCALVDLHTVQLAHRPLQKWLWEEFEIRYSEAVLEEFRSFQSQMSFRERWENYILRFPNAFAYERAIFSLHQRKLEDKHCKRCHQVTWKNEIFTPDFTETKDRGERHNCCIALDIILKGQYSQIIFLTDDFHAVRDYASYFFATFPLECIWSLLDFIIYLFMRHQRNVTLQDIKDALRDVNAGPTGLRSIGNEGLGSQDSRQAAVESEKKLRRLIDYYKKAEHVADIFSRLPGGH